MNIILEPLRLLLELIFNITGDWGIAIIILTVVIRGLIMPLARLFYSFHFNETL